MYSPTATLPIGGLPPNVSDQLKKAFIRGATKSTKVTYGKCCAD